MGYYTDGVTYFIFDDNSAAGGHTPGTPHSLAGFNAAFPFICAEMQDAAGNKTLAGTAYLITANTVVGGKAGVDPFNQTTWTETDTKFIFTKPGATLSIRTQGAVPNVTINWGKKIGTVRRTIGHKGVSYFQASGTVFNMFQNWNAYGCRIEAYAGTVNVSDSASNNSIELGGCLIHAGILIALGGTANGLKAYNSLFTSRRVGAVNFIGTFEFLDSYRVLLGADGVNSYGASSGAVQKKPRGAIFCSDQSIADIRHIGSGFNWYAVSVERSTAPKLFDTSIINVDPDGSVANRVVSEVHFRIMDKLGNPVVNLPVNLSSSGRDYGTTSGFDVWDPGAPLLTNIEGDVSWSHVESQTPNGLAMRSIGTDGSGNEVNYDRAFTLKINHADMVGYNSSYPSRTVVFTGPGRDMNHGTPEAGWGDYYPIITVPVVLEFTKQPGVWEKCEV